jgi:hypothetical protein
MKKYNCLIINNEIWMLEARIKYDLQWFDYIIIAEADSTFSGIKKPFFYEKYSYLFEEYKDRIIYLKISNLPKPYKGNFIGFNDFPLTENRWVVEFEHRNRLKEALSNIAQPDDIICIQDLDEIQNIQYINQINDFNKIQFLSYINFKGSINKPPTKEIWKKGYITNYFNIKKININDYRKIHLGRIPYKLDHIAPSNFRFNDEEKKSVYNSYTAPVQNISVQESDYGWHLSSITNKIDKRMKWQCFSHQEFPHKFKHKNVDIEEVTDNIISQYLDKPSPHPLVPEFINKSRFAYLFFCEQFFIV